MKRTILVIIVLFSGINVFAQNPNPSLVGYWQNWQDPAAPYIQLTQVDTSYNIIPVAFAIPAPGSTYDMRFTPDVGTVPALISDIQAMQSVGKKILISVGGATANIELNDTNERDVFVSSMMTIINTYGFDGLDIDIEGGSLSITGGTIANPVDARVINLIEATKKIMSEYRIQHGKKLLLTMAPETAYVQGGMSAYGGIWGAYLPVIHALRDSIDLLHVQLYNSGSMYGIDGNIYVQSTADFIVSQTEALLQGFNTQGGFFAPLSPEQIVVGLPACPSAAGGGYTDPDTVMSAIKYLFGTGPKPAFYTTVSSYPQLRGMMDWSINWDAQVNCHPYYEYARNFDRIFRIPVGISGTGTNVVEGFSLSQNYPNPFNPYTSIKFKVQSLKYVELKVFDVNGSEIAILVNDELQAGSYEYTFEASALPSGTYFYELRAGDFSETKKMVLIK